MSSFDLAAGEWSVSPLYKVNPESANAVGAGARASWSGSTSHWAEVSACVKLSVSLRILCTVLLAGVRLKLSNFLSHICGTLAVNDAVGYSTKGLEKTDLEITHGLEMTV